MLIDTDKTEPAEALAAVVALLPQIETAALHLLRLRTIPAVMRRRTIEAAQRAGFDVEAGLLAVADVALATYRESRAQIGIAEIDDTPGALFALACDDDDDDPELLEPTRLAEVQPYEIGPEAVVAAALELSEIEAQG